MLGFRKKMLLSGGALLAGAIGFMFLFLDQALDRYLAQPHMPSCEICMLVSQFKIGVLVVGGSFLFLYSLFTWILFNRLSRPLQTITDHILLYTEGGLFPTIELTSSLTGEFGKIAEILNAMLGKIKKQMDHLHLAGKETLEILESLCEGVLAVDTHGQTTFANDSACKILGISRNGVLADPLHKIDALQKSLAEKCYEAIQDVLQTSEIIKEAWTDGRTHIEITAAPRPGLRGAIVVLQDKTADVKVLDMGKEFIANASHELRTPITIIRGFAETLQDHPELSPQMLSDSAQKIVKTSHRLENLVKSLLTLADIENFSQDSLQKTDLVSIAEQCRQFAKAAHPKSEISLDPEGETIPVLGNPQLLDMAIMNLLDNAIKYCREHPQIRIAVCKEGSDAKLTVLDNGIGIPENDLPRVFDRFYTVDKARSRKSGGAGLGLSIVKTIVEKHHGAVSAESEPGRGSAFTLRLPLA